MLLVGRAQFKSCTDGQTNEGCRGTTHLEGEVQGSVEFDARLDYKCGGDCKFKQIVINMVLSKIDENGTSELLFICSNLGSNSRRNCENRPHVSISFQGEDKYDIKLTLHSLNFSNSGRYQLRVNLNEMGRRRSTILKEFDITVRGMFL